MLYAIAMGQIKRSSVCVGESVPVLRVHTRVHCTARNSSVQTASLQCLGAISNNCNRLTFGQITEKSNRLRIETILHIVLMCHFDPACFRREKLAQISAVNWSKKRKKK